MSPSGRGALVVSSGAASDVHSDHDETRRDRREVGLVVEAEPFRGAGERREVPAERVDDVARVVAPVDCSGRAVMVLTGEPDLDGRGRAQVAPPGLPLGAARHDPDVVAVTRVLDDQLVLGAGAIAAVPQHREMPAEALSGPAAQQRSQDRVGEMVRHPEPAAPSHRHDRAPGTDATTRPRVTERSPTGGRGGG